MKTLDSFDFGRTTSVARSQYDWDTILDGKIHSLTPGSDFDCKPVTMKTRVRAVAKKMGLGVRVATTKEGDIVIQAVPKKEEDEFDKLANSGRQNADEDVEEEEEDGEEEEEAEAKPQPKPRRRK